MKYTDEQHAEALAEMCISANDETCPMNQVEPDENIECPILLLGKLCKETKAEDWLEYLRSHPMPENSQK